MEEFFADSAPTIILEVGGSKLNGNENNAKTSKNKKENKEVIGSYRCQNYLNPTFTFANFVEGKSNQLARAAALQVSNNVGKSYNPFSILFISSAQESNGPV